MGQAGRTMPNQNTLPTNGSHPIATTTLNQFSMEMFSPANTQ